MYFLELGINGALSGLMYSLVAMGIVLIYKSSSVPNLAQGALTMLGAYVVLAFANGAGLPMWLAIPLAMVTMFVIGMGIERVALRRLAGRPIVMILMMTLGLDIFLRATTLTIWGGTARPMPIGISDDPLFLGPLLLNRAYVVGAVVALVLFAVFVFFFRTRRGIVLRAIADDYTASWSVGISVERGVALSWAMSSVVATTAGVLWGSVQGVDQSLSLLLLKGITVAVLGGLDSIGGAILAGSAAGHLRGRGRPAILDPLLGGGSRDLVVAAVLILTIMIRPHGLFGRHDIERICSDALPSGRHPPHRLRGRPRRCSRSRPTAGRSARAAAGAAGAAADQLARAQQLPAAVAGLDCGRARLNLILGWAGQFHFGYAAIMGIGAYATVHACARRHPVGDRGGARRR